MAETYKINGSAIGNCVNPLHHKSGQILSVEDMRGLVQKLERCPNPQTSPSGQATLIHMSAQELEREFLRGR